MQEASNRSFANGKICNDKNYTDVIFIIPPFTNDHIALKIMFSIFSMIHEDKE